MAGVELRDYQEEAVRRMRNGCILCGGVGSGKSRTSLAYYYIRNGGELGTNEYVPMDDVNIKDLYIITTARKRDTFEWEEELSPFLLSTDEKENLLEEQVNTADSDIKVQEKRRVDLVYNLADCVKQYDKHEAETLTAIVEGREKATSIENVTTAIAAVTEAYPELKSNENYKELMNELSITENLIAEYRENYNKQIKEYNRYVRKFPTRFFLNILGYETQQYQYLDYSAPVDAPQNLFGD